MSLPTVVIGLLVLVVAGIALGRLLTRRRRASDHPTPHLRVHPESLLADLDDAQGRAEAAAKDWRLASGPAGRARESAW